METQTLSVYLSQPSAAKFAETARSCGLKRGTLMRLVLERWIANPIPLFDLPQLSQQPRRRRPVSRSLGETGKPVDRLAGFREDPARDREVTRWEPDQA